MMHENQIKENMQERRVAMEFDKDLQSIQEVRNLVARAVVAQKELAKMSQEQIDRICCEIAQACQLSLRR